MTSKSDFYAPQHEQQPYQAGGGVPYKEQQDYEILEAGLVPNINEGGRSSAAELEKQLRLGERGYKYDAIIRERRVDVSQSPALLYQRFCCIGPHSPTPAEASKWRFHDP